jgi:hypothetical protein
MGLSGVFRQVFVDERNDIKSERGSEDSGEGYLKCIKILNF